MVAAWASAAETTTVDVAAIPAHGSSCFCSSAEMAAAWASAAETTTVAAAAAANSKKPGRIPSRFFLLDFS